MVFLSIISAHASVCAFFFCLSLDPAVIRSHRGCLLVFSPAAGAKLSLWKWPSTPPPLHTLLQLLCGELCFNYRSESDVSAVASAAIHPAPPRSPHAHTYARLALILTSSSLSDPSFHSLDTPPNPKRAQ